MRTFFFGDLHGNSQALDVCLAHMDELRIDAVYCLGDLVGWLPFGDRTLSRMRSLNLPTVAGNHDLMAAGLFADLPEQLDRMQATAYNAGLLSTLEGSLEYLIQFPLNLETDDFTVVHNSHFHLPDPGVAPTIRNFGYLDESTLEDCLAAWRTYPKRLIISGHDHLPAVYELPDSSEPPGIKDVKVHVPSPDSPLTLRLDPQSRYWVKAGSVGGPYRDKIPVVNAVLVDSDSESVTLCRWPYPLDGLRHELSSHFFARNLSTLQGVIRVMDSWMTR